VTSLREQLLSGNSQIEKMQQQMLAELAELERDHEADMKVSMSTLQSSFEAKAARVAKEHASRIIQLKEALLQPSEVRETTQVRVWRAATSKARPKADVRLDLRVGRVHSLGEESEAQHGPVFTQVAVLRHDAIPVLLLCHVTRAVLRLQPLPLFTPRLA
jgi:hypothetical protein